MVMIQQDKVNLTGYSNLLSKHGKSTFKISTYLIEEDIKRLKSMKERAYSKADRDNIDGILYYLKSLLYNIEDETMSIQWNLDKSITKSSPISIEHFPSHGVRTTDYILLERNSMLRFDFTDLYKIIAFDMMHRDLGYETNEIDKKLDHVGIATITDASEILDIINENESDILDSSKIFRIGDSPYATLNGKLAWDYFGTAHKDFKEAFSSGKYADCVGQSIGVAVSVLNKYITEKLVAAGIKFNICYLGESGLFYLVEDSTKVKDLIAQKYFETVVVRSFGRRFEIIPKISLL